MSENQETKIDQLRAKLISRRKERDKITFEKGMAARDNNDLRENFAYDYWLEKEFVITARILNITKEIEDTAKEQTKTLKQKT